MRDSNTQKKGTRPNRRVVILTKKEATPPAAPAEANLVREGFAFVLFVFGVFLTIALLSAFRSGSEVSNAVGPVGGVLARELIRLLGWCAWVAVLWAFLVAFSVWKGVFPAKNPGRYALIPLFLGSGAMAVSAAAAFSVLFSEDAGGRLGTRVTVILVPLLNSIGTVLVCVATFVLALGIGTGLQVSRLVTAGVPRLTRGARRTWSLSARGARFFARSNLRLWHFVGESLTRREEPEKPRREPRFYPPELPQVASEEPDDEPPSFDISGDEPQPELKISRGPVIAVSASSKRGKGAARKREEPVVDREFELPSVELLVKGEADPSLAPRDNELFANCRQLEKTLLDFRIGGRIVEVHPGPVITLYQFEPAPGIKVQRIINLADDLALSLKVASVRVYAPVPGKGTVGIEVPNRQREIVRLREVLEHQKASGEEMTLTLALGKDTFGESYSADLAAMPHLLIAGATGTGKSVCINSLLLSLLFRNTPRDLRLILIDPKMLELSVYEGIPHLKAPVVTNPKRARGVLWWAVEEMERRYCAMKELGVRSLDSFNRAAQGLPERLPRTGPRNFIELEEHNVIATSGSDAQLKRVQVLDEIPTSASSAGEYLPRIVIVVDELADLMLTVGREIEELLTRLAQKARAAGIHLILATQRPSVNVITGLIKANFPARISFKVASRIDARTVLDVSGAEKLLGQGDMLFLPPGTSRVKRIHSAFVSDREVHDVVHWLRGQGEPDYDPLIEEMIAKLEQSEMSVEGVLGEGEYDPLYDQAVNIVLEKGQASTSMIQRIFRIGYNRAARILETMEREGVIGPADGAKPRQVMRSC